ncbi:MAG TPA: hypothetical protein VHY58_01015 [Streptosporangiaceae bacterium]|jgi:hypothetical protein|nr:hypothetical protein [Streptosporangiaceae bacterium]
MTASGEPPALAAWIRRNAAVLLHGSGLRIEERGHVLIVTNPADPERGQVYINTDDGQVSWERTVTDHWGRLEGVSTGQDPDSAPVPATLIIETLTGQRPAG